MTETGESRGKGGMESVCSKGGKLYLDSRKQFSCNPAPLSACDDCFGHGTWQERGFRGFDEFPRVGVYPDLSIVQSTHEANTTLAPTNTCNVLGLCIISKSKNRRGLWDSRFIGFLSTSLERGSRVFVHSFYCFT